MAQIDAVDHIIGELHQLRHGERNCLRNDIFPDFSL
jgi:hypothetical protein